MKDHTLLMNQIALVLKLCVAQATRILAKHKTILQVKVTDTELCGNTLTMIELKSDIYDG